MEFQTKRFWDLLTFRRSCHFNYNSKQFPKFLIHLLDKNPIKFKGCLNLVTHKQEKWKHSKSWQRKTFETRVFIDTFYEVWTNFHSLQGIYSKDQSANGIFFSLIIGDLDMMHFSEIASRLPSTFLVWEQDRLKIISRYFFENMPMVMRSMLQFKVINKWDVCHMVLDRFPPFP